MDEFKLGKTILTRDGKEKGIITAERRRCTLEGCNGNRIGVKWPDGKKTYPCVKGIEYTKKGFKII